MGNSYSISQYMYNIKDKINKQFQNSVQVLTRVCQIRGQYYPSLWSVLARPQGRGQHLSDVTTLSDVTLRASVLSVAPHIMIPRPQWSPASERREPQNIITIKLITRPSSPLLLWIWSNKASIIHHHFWWYDDSYWYNRGGGMCCSQKEVRLVFVYCWPWQILAELWCWEGREADGSSQAGAGASLGSHSAVAWPGSPVSVGGLTSVHWSHITHVRPVWAESCENTEMMGAVSSKTRGWQYPVQSVTTKSVTQISKLWASVKFNYLIQQMWS